MMMICKKMVMCHWHDNRQTRCNRNTWVWDWRRRIHSMRFEIDWKEKNYLKGSRACHKLKPPTSCHRLLPPRQPTELGASSNLGEVPTWRYNQSSDKPKCFRSSRNSALSTICLHVLHTARIFPCETRGTRAKHCIASSFGNPGIKDQQQLIDSSSWSLL